MKAIVITDKSEPIQLLDVSIPKLNQGECLVKIHAAALNRRDQWMREGKYPGIKFGTILGSDGCGKVLEGPEDWIGKRVIINPNIGWGDNPEVQSSSYTILGMPTDGTLAEFVKVPIDRLVEMPTHLSSVEAACIPLAGLTAFRAVTTKCCVSKSKKVLITGVGGGVSQFALQFAIALGAEVYVTSRDEAKLIKAVEMGAVKGFISSNEDWWKEALKSGPFDAIIDSIGGNSVNSFLKIIKPSGRIVLYGSSTGYPEKFDVFRLFWSQAQLMGSTMGNDQEFNDMIELINTHQIHPTIDQVFEVQDYLQAFDRFKSPDHFGKIVIRFAHSDSN